AEETDAGVRAFTVPMRREPRERRRTETVLREGRQEGGSVKSGERQSESEASTVPERAKHDAEGRAQRWAWAETSIWTERMLAALDNGVKGSKWFSLIDKVTRAGTLRLAWERVAKNRGAAGVDGQSVERFA